MTIQPSDGPKGPAGETRAAAKVGAGIFLSKIFGFVRERIFAHYFGSSGFADAWWAALRMPNVIRNLLGEGTLSASMIPVYAEFLAEGKEEEARRFAGAALGILTLLASGLTLVGFAIAPVLVRLFFPLWAPAIQDLTITLIRILFPMSGLFVISAWALGILNSHRKFFISFVAPVFWNLAMIAAMVGGSLYMGLGGPALVVALAWGALGGGALTLAVQLPFLVGHLGGMRISLGRGVDGVAEAVRNFLPVVAARGVVNLSGWIDLILAGRLVPGAVAVMGYAQTFSNLPIALFGTGVAAAELPEMSRMRGEAERVLASRVGRSLKRALYFLIPAALAYVTLGDVVVGALYQTGEFGSTQTLITWGVLAGYSLGIPASASSRVLSSAFYALRETKTPARIAYLRVAVSIAFGVALMIPADQLGFASLRLGAAGLALGSAIGAWLELGLLTRALNARIGPHGPGAGVVTRMMLAAALGALTGVTLQTLLPAAHPVVSALETLLPFGLVYLSVTALMGLSPARKS
ncbi:MAG: murein biosynthesis integral membrane protein MurJ [Gemmatimonadetes bacterium]|nr:murein biosynthesis integral membrane protein MurJ [Gemmatimonadota bacterium]MDA1104362.1 murein biosynthesis integral membrane protein MurJ [Gemmatimonadota bacterium]